MTFRTSGRRDGLLSPEVLDRLAGQEFGLGAQDHLPLGILGLGVLKCIAGWPQPYSHKCIIHLFMPCGPAIISFIQLQKSMVVNHLHT